MRTMLGAHRAAGSSPLAALVVTLAVMYLPGRPVEAVELALTGGRVARLRPETDGGRAVFYFRGGDPLLGTLGDPRCPAVSALRLRVAVDQYRDIALPCGLWYATSNGFVYRDPSATVGGVRRIVLEDDRLLIKLSGTTFVPIGGPIPFVEVRLAIGSDRACGRFAAFKKNTWERVDALPASGPCAVPRPNVLVINLDDTRFDGIDHMPVLAARLIGEGVAFTQSFVPNPLCCPSRASLLSGLYAAHHQTRTLTPPLGGARSFRETGADQQTIAVWLRSAGYRTGLFGKYLNAYSGSEATAAPGGRFYVPPGWDRWRAMSSNEHYGGVLGPTYQLVDEHGLVSTYDNHETDEQYSTDLLAQEVRAFVAESLSAGRNFFAVYAPYASHGDAPNFNPHPALRHLDAFLNLPLWRPPNFNEGDLSDKPFWVQALAPATPIGVAVNDLIRRRAYETLLAVDEQLALFLGQLEAFGVADDTIIIFTSDNGVTWGEHGFFAQGKECPYEEAIRVPMIVRYPLATTAGPAVADGAVLNIDIAPTVAALAGVPVPVAVDGRSFAGWLGGDPPADWRTDFLLEHWRGVRNTWVTYSDLPADGDRLRLLYGNPWAKPRAAAVFEFDAGNGVSPGNVGVPIGATPEETYTNLGSAIAAAVPFTVPGLNVSAKRLVVNDTSPQLDGIQFIEEVDQGNTMIPLYPLPDYFGVRDVANGFTYVEHETGEVELYDLTADPYQLENVATAPAYQAQRLRLESRLAELLAEQ